MPNNKCILEEIGLFLLYGMKQVITMHASKMDE